MQNKAQILNYFIASVVNGWMLTDLERLTNDIPHRPGASGNCNFPIALYTFACIEFLGQLTYAGKSLPKKGYTQASIMGFIDNFFPDDFKQKLQPHRANFVNIFRNGLAHNYFAKAAGISRTKPEPFSVEDGHLILDADRFAEAFKLAVSKLKEAIKTNDLLVERMVDRYDAQYKGNLKFRLPTSTIQFHSTPVSGASLAHPSMTSGLISSTNTSGSSRLRNDSKTTTTLPYAPEPKSEDKKKD